MYFLLRVLGIIEFERVVRKNELFVNKWVIVYNEILWNMSLYRNNEISNGK